VAVAGPPHRAAQQAVALQPGERMPARALRDADPSGERRDGRLCHASVVRDPAQLAQHSAGGQVTHQSVATAAAVCRGVVARCHPRPAHALRLRCAATRRGCAASGSHAPARSGSAHAHDSRESARLAHLCSGSIASGSGHAVPASTHPRRLCSTIPSRPGAHGTGLAVCACQLPAGLCHQMIVARQ
jgi:hypothetical protein